VHGFLPLAIRTAKPSITSAFTSARDKAALSSGCKPGFSHFVTSMTAPLAFGWREEELLFPIGTLLAAFSGHSF
jgi:hypothetical protein